MAGQPIKITTVCPFGAYWLRVSFSDGMIKDVDLRPHLRGPVFGPLRNLDAFEKVRIDAFGHLRWPTGAGLPPETLYEQGIPYRKAGVWAA